MGERSDDRLKNLNRYTSTYASDILREIDHRLRVSLDTLLEGVQVVGYDWTYLYLNRTAAQHGRRNREDLLGRSMLKEYPGIEKTEVFAVMRECMESRKPRRMKNLFTFPDGSDGWFDLSIQPVPEGIFILSINVTEDQKRQEALRESEERFRLISENVGDLIVLLDTKGRRLYNSPSYRSVLGEPEALRGTDSFREIHEEDRERVKKLFQETVRSGKGMRTEYRFHLPDGTLRHIESNGTPVKDAGGKVTSVVVVARDVTERKLIEREYLRSQRLDSIGTLAGGIAHDLNNVLAPILASIDMLRRSVHTPEGRSMLDALEASAKRGADLVKQVLSFARGSEGARATVDVSQVVGEVRRLITLGFPPAVRLRTEIEKNLWNVRGDSTQIHQVIMNLAVNARDAMPRGGRLTIAAENATVGKRLAGEHPGAAEGRYVRIAVSDQGTGIAPGLREKIFDPFFTTKQPGMGTGLGLSTSNSIVRGHGGFIALTSEEGKGSTFSVYLPRETVPGPKARSAHNGPPPGNGELVLVVDDEEAIRQIARTSLEAYGYSVLTAANGAEAVTLYADMKKSIDIVMTDLVMPFMDGHATIRELQKLNPEVKILGVSGLLTAEYRSKYPDTGSVRFLPKPYTTEGLLSTLREMLEAPA